MESSQLNQINNSDDAKGNVLGIKESEIKGRIVVFSITNCKYCRATKSLLGSKGIPYTNVNLDDFPERREEVAQLSGGKRTVPQIFFNNKHIGGNSDLEALESSGELNDLVIKTLLSDIPADAPRIPSESELKTVEEKKKKLKDDELSMPIMKDIEPNSSDEKNIIKVIHAIRQTEENGGLLIQARWQNFGRYSSCFAGNELVDWLIKNKYSSNRDEAAKFGQRLFNFGFFYNVLSGDEFKDNSQLYRFYQDDDKNIMNMLIGSDKSDKSTINSAKKVSMFLSKQISEIYEKYLLPDGSAMDYDGLAASDEFTRFSISTCRLNHVNIDELAPNERKTVFINLYNALNIHGNIVFGELSGMSKLKFFQTVSYMIGGERYTMNDIEHGILRGNKPMPYMIFNQFGRSDVRNKYVLPLDPRIHFALNCGAKSCPAVKLYSTERLEEELDIATKGFFENKSSFELDESTKTVYLSSILYWYESDFGSSVNDRLKFISKFLPESTSSLINKWIDEKVKINIKIKDYDWSQNSTKSRAKI